MEFPNALVGDPPGRKILPSERGVGGLQEMLVKRSDSPLHRVVELLFVVSFPLSLGFFEDDPCSVRKDPESFRKRDPFATHDEAEDIPADVAYPTFPGLAVDVDLKTWTAIVVKRAGGDEVSSLPTDLGVAADQVNNVDRQANSIFDLVVYREGHSFLQAG